MGATSTTYRLRAELAAEHGGAGIAALDITEPIRDAYSLHGMRSLPLRFTPAR